MGARSGRARAWVASVLAAGSLVAITGVVRPASAADPDKPASARMNTFLPDTPDPEVYYTDGHFWAFATETANLPIPLAGASWHIPVMRSDSIGGQWSAWGDALPEPGPWVYDDDTSTSTNMRYTWAPAVQHVGSSWVMFYTAPRGLAPGSTDSKQRCIGRAVADSPGGPYVDSSATPFYCPSGDTLWAIDPSVYRDDDGSLYLLWREDNGAQPTGPHVNAGRLDANAASISQKASSFLLATDADWEKWGGGGLIENPAMEKGAGPSGPTYYLFYSGNAWDTENYATGYATCSTPLGPCTKQTDSARGPWLHSSPSDTAKGPGGAEVFHYGGDVYMAWHAWTAPSVGYGAGGARGLRVAKLGFDSAGPHLVRPMQGQRVDHAFMIDTTGSMWDDIDAVRRSAGEIIGRLSESGADWRVGIVEYKDYPQAPWGDPGDFTGRMDVDFTNNFNTLLFALGLLQASGGNDTPESFLSAAMVTLDPGRLHWRNQMGVKKSITPFTDAAFHSPEPWAGGHTIGDVFAAAWSLDPAVFYPVVIGGDTTATAAFQTVADSTGGRLFAAANASEVVDAILDMLTAVLQTPTAVANGPYAAVAGVPVILDATGSGDSDGTIVDYSWDLDSDGTYDVSATTPTVQATYPTPGDFTATLKVTDNDGLSQTALATVHVEPAPAGGDHVGVHVSGPYTFDAEGTLAGGLSTATDRFGLVAIKGAGNVGTQPVGFDVSRFWILPLYFGSVKAGAASVPVLFARVSWDGVTRTASSTGPFVDFGRFPWTAGRLSWKVTDAP